MKPQNLCPQCGAHINIETLECPFCKAIYKGIDLPQAQKDEGKKKTRLLIAPPENITDSMLIKKIISATPHYKSGNSTLFYSFGTIFALIAVVLLFLTNIIPAVACYAISAVLGVMFVVFMVLGYLSSKVKNESFIVKLIVKKDYEGAAELAKKHSDQNSCKIAYMLINYFRLSDYQLVKKLIFDFDLNKLTKNQYALYEEVSGNFISKL